MAEQALEQTKIPSAVQLVLNGMPCLFLEIPEDGFPLGLRLDLTRVGELAPVESGHLGPGASLLLIGPQVVQFIKAAAGPQIAKARQAAARPSPLLTGH